RFRSDPRLHVILMSYGTGSVGLNLQFTNYVFLFDRWWNPAVEDQAINRAHRIGQKEPVFVKRFVTQDTIEGRIADVLERKRQLVAQHTRVVVRRAEQARAAAVAGEQQRRPRRRGVAGQLLAQQQPQVLVGRLGVADVQLHRLADADAVVDRHRPGRAVDAVE